MLKKNTKTVKKITLKKIKENEEDLVLKNLKNNSDEFNFSKTIPANHWLQPTNILINKDLYSSLTLAGMITGCGVLQMQGVVSLVRSGVTKTRLRELMKPYCRKIGPAICTLGQNYFNGKYQGKTYEEILMSLGFEYLAEYKNYNHGNNYKQRLYLYRIE